jgi:hypothetical protein
MSENGGVTLLQYSDQDVVLSAKIHAAVPNNLPMAM